MLRKLLSLLIFVSSLAILPLPVFAQNSQEKFYKAEVIAILEEGSFTVAEKQQPFQVVKIRYTDSDKKGTEETLDHGRVFSLSEEQLVSRGDKVVLVETYDPDGKVLLSIRDKYRLDTILDIAVIFVIFVLIVAGIKGFGALVGLAVSLLIILKFIVPQILGGADPVVVSVFGAFVILFTTIYLSHGFSRQTTVALISTLVVLVVTAILSLVFVSISKLTGLGDDNAAQLQFGVTEKINLSGLLLGGMIIGALGVLDDVTTTQSAAVFELKKANPTFNFRELFRRSYRVGKEHVVSVVNTLVLAYAGASLSIFIFLVLNPLNYPYWVILNSEFFAEEIVRTIAGSLGLVLAVPITSLIASYVSSKKI